VGQEFGVVTNLLEAADQQLHGFNGRKRIEHTAQDKDALQIFLGDEQLFLAGSGALDIDGREHALVDQLAVEDDFHVAGALELFEDDFVHAGAGVDEGGCDDGERAAFLDVAGRAEEALGPLQSVGVNAAREDFAGGRNDGVVGARQAGDGVEQNDDVALVLDEALGLLDDHFGHLHVARGGLVESRTDDFALHRALHVGDFLGAFVNKQNNQHDLWMVRCHRIGDGLQQHGFAGAGRSDNETALALADRREQVHHAAADALAHCLHLDALLRIERREVVKENLVARLLGRLEVDGFDLDEREILLALMGRAHVAADRITGLEIELANLRGRHVNVVRSGQIVVVRGTEEAVAVGEDFKDAFSEDVAFLFALRLEDLENEILLAEAAGPRNLKGAGNAA